MKSIGMSDELHKRYKILSIILNKKMWEMIDVAADTLEEKYKEEIKRFHDQTGENHE